MLCVKYNMACFFLVLAGSECFSIILQELRQRLKLGGWQICNSANSGHSSS